MSDDRDRRRPADPLHPDALGATWGDDEATPVGKPSRRARREATPPPALVAAGVIDTDHASGDCAVCVPRLLARIAEAEALADAAHTQAAACAAAELRRDRRRKWLVTTLAGSGALLFSVLFWAVSKLDARADAAAQERIRVLMLQRHDVEIRALQLQEAAAAAVLGLRASAPP